MVTQAARCIPLLPQVSHEAGAMMLVNPLTSMAFISIARQEKHAAIVNTAAASALGQMITRLGLRYGIPVISVVRRTEQADLLRRQGFVHIVDSSQPGFEETLRTLTHTLRATLLLDAIAGESTGQLAAAAPYGSKILLYGALSGQPARVEAWHFLSEAKRLEGFHLANWLQQKNLAATFSLAMQVQRLLSSDLQSQVQRRFPISQAQEAVTWYSTNMSTGKVLLIPDA
jgi:NADPH:quinone reductase-like Zn-dependent oxidoreductase